MLARSLCSLLGSDRVCCIENLCALVCFLIRLFVLFCLYFSVFHCDTNYNTCAGHWCLSQPCWQMGTRHSQYTLLTVASGRQWNQANILLLPTSEWNRMSCKQYRAHYVVAAYIDRVRIGLDISFCIIGPSVGYNNCLIN